MTQSLYTSSAVDKLMNEYIEKGGEIIQMRDPVLGCGDILMYGDGLKTTVVTEVYLDMYSSAHKIRMYHKIPEKYKRIIEKHEKESSEMDESEE